MLFLALIATAAAFSRVEMEAKHTHTVPQYWKAESGRLNAEVPLPLIFAVKLRNTERLEREFNERSDPDHADYGKWYTQEQIVENFGPAPSSLRYVATYLKKAGFSDIKVLKSGFVKATTTVGAAERLLQTRLQRYTATHFKPLIRAVESSSYSLPAPLARHIDFVGGIKGQFPTPHHQHKIVSHKRQGVATTPDVIANTYGTKGIVGKNSNSSEAFVELIGQHFAQSDVNTFFNQFVQGHSAPTYKIEGGANNGPTGTESALDSEYLAAVGLGIQPSCWSVQQNSQQPFLEWISHVNAAKSAPYIFSISYGESEPGNSLHYLARLDNEFKKLGLRGITVFIASGDSGVSAQPGGCTSRVFDPDWPATSPSIVAIGGSQLNGPGNTQVWTEGGSGFSSFFVQPAWQKAAVTNYINTNNNLPPRHFYNVSNRAYPDLAGYAANVPIIQDGQTFPVGGTSCATPITAAVFALVQDALFEAGAKHSFGFVNPLIYKVGNTGFTDISQGNCNEGCEGTHGFCTQKSFDLATGWGEANYPMMLSSFKNAMPASSFRK